MYLVVIPASEKYIRNTIHGQTPAAQPNQKGVQSVLVVYWFRTSINKPNRFMHAFTAGISSKDASRGSRITSLLIRSSNRKITRTRTTSPDLCPGVYRRNKSRST